MSEWISVEDKLPDSGKKVIATYKNALSKTRRIMAFYAPRFTIDSTSDDDEGVGEYNETDDEYYLTEGWWECIDNWGDYAHIKVNEGEVTHWMPLPEPPEEIE